MDIHLPESPRCWAKYIADNTQEVAATPSPQCQGSALAKGQHGAPGTKPGPKLARRQVWGHSDDSQSPQKSKWIYFPAQHLPRRTSRSQPLCQAHSSSAAGHTHPLGNVEHQPSGTVALSRTQPSEGHRTVWRGSRPNYGNSAWPKSQSPGLSLNLLLSVQAFWV